MLDRKPLRELLSFIVDNRGRTCPTADEGLPLIATNCVKNSTLFPVFQKVRFVDQNTYEEWFRAHPKPGDLIFVLKGSPGQVCLTPDPTNFCIAQDMVALRANAEKIYPPYLFAALRSPEIQEAIGNLHVGSMIPHFKKGDFDRLEIPVPDWDHQVAVGDLFLKICQKIEANSKTASTLEEMARALYRSWFVDFDPVHARSQGLPPAHMPTTAAALFPDSFNDNGLPEGWELVSIYDAARVQYGAPFKSKLFNTEKAGRPLVRIRDLKNQRAGVYTTEVNKKEYLLQAGDTVVGMDGDFTPYTWSAEPSLMNQRVCAFLPHKETDRSFVRYSVPALLKAEENAAVATTVIHLGKKDIDTFEIVSPSDPIRAAYGEIANPLLDKGVRLELQNQTLATLRDTLLPRLMSGELRVGDAREQIKEAL